jgi:hypothetical protein
MFFPPAPSAQLRISRAYRVSAQFSAQYRWRVHHIRANLSHLAGKIFTTKGAQ